MPTSAFGRILWRMTRRSGVNLGPLTASQLAGEACFECGSEEPPLHPAGTVTVPDELTDVVHDYDAVVCTSCLVVER